jgi:hypothetical protein
VITRFFKEALGRRLMIQQEVSYENPLAYLCSVLLFNV